MNDDFENFITSGEKKEKSNNSFFKSLYSRGLVTSRDAWVYNYAKEHLIKNLSFLIENYNAEVEK